MKRLMQVSVAVLLLVQGSVVSATMLVRGLDVGIDEKRYDRFYVGEDKDFIGDAYDWSGVGRVDVTGSNSRWATMISPHYFLGSEHFAPSNSLTFFHSNDPDGTSETHSIESGTQIGSTDLWLGKLSTPVTDDVAKYPILGLPAESDYDNRVIYTFGLTVPDYNATATAVRLGRNNIDPGSYQDATDEHGSTGRVFLFDYDHPTGGMGDDETYLRRGDSGGPSFTIVNGEPALVGIHWTTWEDDTDPDVYGSVDTFVPEYIDDLQTQMQTIGESATSVVPEPATPLMLLGLGMTWLVWHRWRRSSPAGNP